MLATEVIGVRPGIGIEEEQIGLCGLTRRQYEQLVINNAYYVFALRDAYSDSDSSGIQVADEVHPIMVTDKSQVITDVGYGHGRLLDFYPGQGVQPGFVDVFYRGEWVIPTQTYEQVEQTCREHPEIIGVP